MMDPSFGLPTFDLGLDMLNLAAAPPPTFSTLDNPFEQTHHEISGVPAAKRSKAANDHSKVVEGTKKFHCPHCQRSYSRKTHLQRHMAVHSNKPAFQCDECNRGFFRRDHFNYHKRTHTNERPYVCQHQGCTAAFRQQSALSRHENKHRRHRAHPQAQVANTVFANSISPSGSQEDIQLPQAFSTAANPSALPTSTQATAPWTNALPQAPTSTLASNQALEQLMATLLLQQQPQAPPPAQPLYQPSTMMMPNGEPAQLATLVQLLLQCKAVLEGC
eukprot:m.80015 g.80015  ORF g.80015 m.80015 type:complete len:275 (+) comp14530_c0_seq1:113-937(+)